MRIKKSTFALTGCLLATAVGAFAASAVATCKQAARTEFRASIKTIAAQKTTDQAALTKVNKAKTAACTAAAGGASSAGCTAATAAVSLAKAQVDSDKADVKGAVKTFTAAVKACASPSGTNTGS